MHSIVMFSGGLKSTVALCQQIIASGPSNVTAVYCMFNTLAEAMELAACRALCARYRVKLEVVDLRQYAALLKSGNTLRHPPPLTHADDLRLQDYHIPALMHTLAGVGLGLATQESTVVIAGQRADMLVQPDANTDMQRMLMLSVFEHSHGRVSLAVKFSQLLACDIVALGNADAAPLHESYSCLRGYAKHCGECPGCYNRQTAFYQAGVRDATKYKVPANFKATHRQ